MYIYVYTYIIYRERGSPRSVPRSSSWKSKRTGPPPNAGSSTTICNAASAPRFPTWLYMQTLSNVSTKITSRLL